MADSIQATPPKSGWLLKLADALRGAAERAAPALDLPGLPLFEEAYKSLARGTEGWAYGDSPIDTRANTPLVNERTADMAGALPIGAVGSATSKAGLLVPILRGLNKTKEPLLLKQVDAAERLKKAGATIEDLWHDTGLHEVRRTTNLGRDPYDAKWAHEVDVPKEDFFSPYGQMTENDKIDFFNAEPGMKSRLDKMLKDVLSKNTSSQGHREYSNLMANEVPLPGEYDSIAGIAQLDELFLQYPALEAMKLEVFPKSSRHFNSGDAGYYYKHANKIEINPLAALLSHRSGANPVATTVHELQHGIQNAHGAPGGGSTSHAGISHMQESNMPLLYKGLVNVRNQGGGHDPHVADKLLKQLMANDSIPDFQRYQNFMGEADARRAATRAFMTPQFRKGTPPAMDIPDVNSADLLDPEVWGTAKQITDPKQRQAMGFSSNPDDWGMALIAALRNKKAVP